MQKCCVRGRIALAIDEKVQKGPFEWVLFSFTIASVYVRCMRKWLFKRLAFAFGRVWLENLWDGSMWWVETGELYGVLGH